VARRFTRMNNWVGLVLMSVCIRVTWSYLEVTHLHRNEKQFGQFNEWGDMKNKGKKY